MNDLTYEQLTFCTDYLKFTIALKRLRSFRLHLGEEAIADSDGNSHHFDVIWFKDTEELIAVEVEESIGIVLPLNFRLKRGTDRYLYLGQFTEEGIDDLLLFQGNIIKHLWTLYTQESL